MAAEPEPGTRRAAAAPQREGSPQMAGLPPEDGPPCQPSRRKRLGEASQPMYDASHTSYHLAGSVGLAAQSSELHRERLEPVLRLEVQCLPGSASLLGGGEE